MATTTAPPVPQSSQPPRPSPSHRRHRNRQQPETAPRGNSGRRRGAGRGNANINSCPATSSNSNAAPADNRADLPWPASSSSADTTARGSTGRGRGRGGRRRGRNAASQPSRVEVGPGRRFEGNLTRTSEAAGGAQPQAPQSDEQGLRADAPTFVPGQAPSQTQQNVPMAPTSTKSKGKQPQRQQRTAKKSMADDMATRIHEDISHAVYECPICTSELGRRSKVWSCHLCWTVFHLTCIKKWSGNQEAIFYESRGIGRAHV